MDIHDLMSNLGITPTGDETPATTPEQPEKNAQLARQDLAQTVTPTETTPVTPEQTPAPVASCAQNDAPAPGRIYALTGGTDQPSIANGNTWAESEVREFAPEKGDRVRYINPRARAVFKAGAGRRAHARDGSAVPTGTEGIVLWEGVGRFGHRLMLKADDGAVWRTSATNCEAVAEAPKAPARDHEQTPAPEATQALAARAAELETAIAQVEAIDVDAPDAGEQLAQVGLPEVISAARDDVDAVALDVAFQAFRATRDLTDAATLQRAMTAYIQAGV